MSNYDARIAVRKCSCCDNVIREGDECFDLKLVGLTEVLCIDCMDLAHRYDVERGDV